jgi:glucose/arabinose dehydrogenase
MKVRPAVRIVVALTTLGACAACGSGHDARPGPSAAVRSPRVTAPPATATTTPGRIPEPTVTGTVAEGLRVPWGVALLPGGGALVAERDTARILLISSTGRISTAGTVPGVDPAGEGGLLGLAVSPHLAGDHLIYAYFTADRDNRIVRMTYRNNRLGPPQVIADGIPKGPIHNGGRLAFGPDGMLYAGTGESGRRGLAQDRSSLGGKILRMTPEGRPAPGNPFGSLVYSYGHRNVQGLAFDSRGRLWASEFGQDTWDELNLIRRGANYGWPVVEGVGHRAGFVDPVAEWHTDDASPSGLTIVNDVAYMAALKGSRLWQIPLAGEQARTPRAFFTHTYGRLRTVLAAPGGMLWLTTSNTDGRGQPHPGDDRILRVALRGAP